MKEGTQSARSEPVGRRGRPGAQCFGRGLEASDQSTKQASSESENQGMAKMRNKNDLNIYLAAQQKALSMWTKIPTGWPCSTRPKLGLASSSEFVEGTLRLRNMTMAEATTDEADKVFFAIHPDEKVEIATFRGACLEVVAPLLRGYVWQHQQFDLLAADSAAGSIPYLYGSTRYGDNVEDEWFVVFLLFEISRSMSRLSIRVWDTDGDFLLVEAAYALPRWLEPDNSDNRVFIRDGLLHIVALPPFSAPLALSQALDVLRSGSMSTLGTDAVQGMIESRIQVYREQPLAHMHKARCILPLSVAHVLRQDPQLVAMAVEGFYDRDIDSMKVAARLQEFVSDFERVQMVETMVSMSRTMYAQLVQQVFQAPPRYPMPALSSRDFRAAELGMKLTCGFEMMYANAASAAGQGLEGDAGWKVYRANLESSGYFKGLLEGSKEHKKLLQAASEHYMATGMRQSTSAFCRRIKEFLSLPHEVTDFSAAGEEASDEAWLYRGEEDLSKVLKERQRELDDDDGDGSEDTSGFVEDDEWDPTEVAKTMQAFVDKVSTYEGAELPDRERSDRGTSPVSLDVMQFMAELESALLSSRKEVDDGSVSEGSMSDVELSETNVEECSPTVPKQRRVRKATKSEPSSDREVEDDIFLKEYDAALNSELGGSTLQSSFVQSDETNASPEVLKPECSDLAPVDVDTNLVKNLLESYALQEGLPGPASNMLGVLGLSLPRVKRQGY